VGHRGVVAVVGLCGLVTLSGCSTSTHLSGLARCEAVYHSGSTRPATPPSVQRLNRTMRLGDILMQPIAQDYTAPVPASRVWTKSALSYERLAHYRLLLATVTTPSPNRGGRELLDHQPAWVVLESGGAGPVTGPMPVGANRSSPPACIFFNTGFSVMNANTGQMIVEGG
jgi:hypothetical protein